MDTLLIETGLSTKQDALATLMQEVLLPSKSHHPEMGAPSTIDLPQSQSECPSRQGKQNEDVSWFNARQQLASMPTLASASPRDQYPPDDNQELSIPGVRVLEHSEYTLWRFRKQHHKQMLVLEDKSNQKASSLLSLHAHEQAWPKRSLNNRSVRASKIKTVEPEKHFHVDSSILTTRSIA